MVICALCPRVFRGFGPSIPGSLNVLRQLIVKDGRKETIVDTSTGFKVSISATGINATTLSNQNAILNLYPKAADMKKVKFHKNAIEAEGGFTSRQTARL